MRPGVGWSSTESVMRPGVGWSKDRALEGGQKIRFWKVGGGSTTESEEGRSALEGLALNVRGEGCQLQILAWC